MRLRFRYSLRFLLLCWILLGIGLAWGGIKWREGKRQAAAISTLQISWNCHVEYENYDPPSNLDCFPQPRTPTFSERMVEWFGVDAVHHVEDITLHTPVEDSVEGEAPAQTPFEQWKLLLAFPKLKSLELTNYKPSSSPWIHDNYPPQEHNGIQKLAQLRHLEQVCLSGFTLNKNHLAAFHNHPRLQVLDLGGCSIEPDALSGLGKLERLECLRISMDLYRESEESERPELPGAECFSLPPCPNLEILDLSFVPCTAQIMQGLSEIPQLKTLYLSKFEVTPAAIDTLRKLPQLKHLSLEFTHLLDKDYAQIIRALPNLEVIDLSYTSAHEETLQAVAGMPHLRAVKLTRTPAEKESLIAAFSRQQPNIEVSCSKAWVSNWIELHDPDYVPFQGLFQ